MSLNPLKAIPNLYKRMELISGTGQYYDVRTKFNDQFQILAQEHAKQRMRDSIFDRDWKDKQPEDDKKAGKSWTATDLPMSIINDEFGMIDLYNWAETSKIILACKPVDDAPPVESILSYIDQERVDEIKGFFTPATKSVSQDSTEQVTSEGGSKKRSGARKRN